MSDPDFLTTDEERGLVPRYLNWPALGALAVVLCVLLAVFTIGVW